MASCTGSFAVLGVLGILVASEVCKNDLDCSLNGACVNGACLCDPAWAGERCTELQLLPADLHEGYNRLAPSHGCGSVSSWGASQLHGEDGVYHTFVEEITGGCGIDAYESNEQIIHATSPTPEGPWQRQGPILGPVAVCPHAVRSPEGLWLVFHTGCGNATDPRDPHKPRMDCSNGTTPELARRSRARGESGCSIASDFASIFYSESPWGPWQQHMISVPQVTVNGITWPGYTGNPSPLILPNGTSILLFRNYIGENDKCIRAGGRPSKGSYPGCTLIGLARAPHWRGPYEVVPGPIVPTQQEDPHIYRTPRGFHAIFHGMDPWPSSTAVGRHAFSTDGVHWFGGDVNAFNTTVELKDGKVEVSRRERPEMVLDAAGNPVALISAVGTPADWGAGDQTFTLIQRVRTSEATLVV